MKLLGVAAAIATLAVCAAATQAQASVLYYAGDPTNAGGYAGTNGGADNYMDFEDFVVPTGQTWYVTAVFADIGIPDYSAEPTPTATWSINTGLSGASQGTVIAHGTSTGGTTSDVLNSMPVNGGNATGVTQTITLPSTVTLTGGKTYWVAVNPAGSSEYHLFMGGTGSNTNGVGGPFDQFSYQYYPGGYQTPGFDWSEGVIGTLTQAAAVPEPASWAMLGTGLLGLLAARRRRAVSREWRS